jgi:hypothetical protein
MSDSEFISLINQLDALDVIYLPEDDEDALADFYDNLYNVCPNQIDNNLSNTSMLPNRGESIGDFMNFLRMTHI